nr:RNA-directed DNA polymerase, eukaryota, reverse transcriptase zinc-binding domain protein [Tanacetum cinerariifolium]
LIDLHIGGCYYTWMNKAGTKLTTKLPSPYGFSFAFVKKYWVLLKKDIFEFVDSFLASGTMPQGANSSFFTLIPKVSNPIHIKDFHPISLIGIHYKIIAKILANRISKVIDKIVSKEQSAFIASRQILEGPLILSEVINWFKKIQKKMLIFKVDFEKAFDSVNWKYLDFVLLSLGFDSKWRYWIRACLHSSRASILINDSPKFSIKRDLRHANPLSIFLFILVMEGLNCAMSNADSSGLNRGIKISSSDFTLSHLFYANDVIITTDWNSGDLDNIICVLHVFYLASGLKINIHKSNIFGIGFPNGDVVDMARRTVTLVGEQISPWKGNLLSNKAPSPDGFSFAFVKKYRDLLKKDIYEFVDSFLASGTMPQGANSSFFTLILKVSNPIHIKDFRPISLIGIYYKIIAKILANRLSKVIDKIVSKEQSAFIASQKILDGPLILSEESSYEVLKGFLRGVVVDVEVKQQRGDVACFVARIRSRGFCKVLVAIVELGDQVRLERWQGMVKERAARSDNDGLLYVQGEESTFFLVPKVMARLSVTMR